MDEYDLEKEQAKYKKYISEWSQLIKKLQRPPIEGASDDQGFDANRRGNQTKS